MNLLTGEIFDEASKLIRRHEIYARQIADESVRRQRRTTRDEVRLEVIRPWYWSVAAGFDPYRTRARALTIGHAVRASIRRLEFLPRNPVAYSVPKEDGSIRRVSVFQVADNAVSRTVFKNILRKNLPRLSSRSYAYREDVSVYDAVHYMASEWRRHDRLFVAEYDFSKYFDNLDHDYLWNVIDDERYLMTPVERHVLGSFLAAPTPVDEGYVEHGGERRTVGVPQGTSVSLFLANAAAAPLDRALERLGVGFVRYADDTVIWSSDYGQLCRAVEDMHHISRDIGAELNPEKSEGIRLLVRAGVRAELPSTTSVDFVGHNVTLDVLGIKESARQRIRHHIGQLIYFNLLREPLQGTQDLTRLGRVDRDYVVFVWQARRYLYGDLTESEVQKYGRGGVPLRRFKGLLAFYPLVDDERRLEEIDRWLARTAWLALRKRARLLRDAGTAALPDPHDVSLDELVHYRRRSTTTGGVLDLRLPSVARMAAVVRKAAERYGPNRVGQGRQPYDY